jgi:ATP-dependent Clp protease ATP-binding subunit ClpC
MKGEVVLKYSEALDQFLQIRVLSGADLEQFLRGATATRGRSAYQVLVIRTCIVGAEAGLKALTEKAGKILAEAALAEHLYHLCVDVNPPLEIHQVTVPGGGSNGRRTRRPSSGGAETAPAADPEVAYVLPRERLLRLEDAMNRLIVGQPEAVKCVTQAVRKASLGLRDSRRPVGAFLMVGKTGTGKTEFAKAICRAMHDDLQRLVRIDCSEYALPHEYAKLIGAPPGYIGHNEGGFLTETVKEKKHCVVLFDEVEKAHPKVHHLLLQLLDEGMLTDGKGAPADFRQCLVLMTSNLGTAELERMRSRLGFVGAKVPPLRIDDIRSETTRAIRKFFRPEFLNRLDDILVFNGLELEDCSLIVQRLLEDFARQLHGCGIRLRFAKDVCDHLAREGFSEEYGARELRRLVQRQVEDPIADAILWDQVKRGTTLTLRPHEGKVEYVAERTRAATAKA